VVPVYRTFPGWKGSADARTWEELPGNTRSYLAWLETELATPVRWVSNGPERSQLVERPRA